MKSEQLEEMVAKVQALPDGNVRQTTLDLVQAILILHAEGLERMLEIVAGAEGGPAILDALGADARASSILLLHDLHPLDTETRIARALDDPAFRVRGASVQLVSIEDGVIRVRIEGGPGLKHAVEQALWEAAPDAVKILVEGGAEPGSKNFVPLEALLSG